jgi:hypothetical protein
MRIGLPALALAVGCWLAVSLVPSHAYAQLSGANTKGDFGLLSGSQAAPGFNVAVMFLRYGGDTLRDRNGDSIRLDPEERGSLVARGFAPGIVYVSDFKILGANYGLMVFPALTNNNLEIPVLGLNARTDTGFGDTFVQPINLGWHTPRADFITGLTLYVPTGSYDPEASDNLGQGMWTFEPFVGTTLFFDQAQSWHLAATAFYEIHSSKRDTDISVGDILTLEGGFGKSFLEGAANVGVAYYAQWKVTDDQVGRDLEELLEGRRLGKHRVFGIGPEVTVPIATRSKLIAVLNVRYSWEAGARTTLEGQNLVITATIPIPSVRLQ